MKHSRFLYGLFAVLGIIFLILAIVGNYLNASDAVSILAPLSSQLGFLLGGMVFATTGILGIGRHYIKNSLDPFTRRRLGSFSKVVIILVPLAAFGAFAYLLEYDLLCPNVPNEK